MHQYRYERSRTVGKKYNELFLLIKLVIIKLERKRKKTKKNICTNLRVTSMAYIVPTCALLRAHLDVL